MTILLNESCGERRIAVMDGDVPVQIILWRDKVLNFGDIVDARITAFHLVLKGYFAETKRGSLFIPTTRHMNEGETVRVQITKESRSGKDATAHFVEDENALPEIEADQKISVAEMDEIIAEAMAGTVSFGQGAFLQIEKTQVAWTIDVDSGQSSETLASVNQKAVKEIARQIRLKNMAGLILVDLAGTKRGQIGKTLETVLREALQSDELVRACHRTPAGLFEIERRRERADLWTLCAPGNIFAVYYRVRRAIEACRSGNPIVRVAPEVLGLLRKDGIHARFEPIFNKTMDNFEIEE